ncbi:AarF/UbiB family protein, partial [Frankia sp. EI5c]|uniref:AarF/UbiB family protein n=1 Tax=Frankia sp. EI5c TaxID=683316 RepID=UPI001F5B8B39
LSTVIESGTQEERDRAGLLLVRFLYSCPGRAGLLHADPHPGNFRLLPDGRLGVLDFGAVNRLPEGLPEPIGRLARLTLAGDAEAVAEGLRAEGFIPAGASIPADGLLDYLAPMLAPIAQDEFTFSRGWLRGEALRLGDWRSAAAQLGRQLNLPPSYLLIHRVTLGAIGILCQLGSSGPFRAEMERWQPGFAAPRTAAARHAKAANRPGRRLPGLDVEVGDGTAVARARPGPVVLAPAQRASRSRSRVRPPEQAGPAETSRPASRTRPAREPKAERD